MGFQFFVGQHPLFLKILSREAPFPDRIPSPLSKEGSPHNHPKRQCSGTTSYEGDELLVSASSFMSLATRQILQLSQAVLYISIKCLWIHRQRGPSSLERAVLSLLIMAALKDAERENFPCSCGPGPIQQRSQTLPSEGVSKSSQLLQANVLCLG